CKPYFRILAQDSLHDHVAGLFKHKFSQLPVNLMNCISHVFVILIQSITKVKFTNIVAGTVATLARPV
ncbi:hypothetical protein RB620_29870, partial [Paenibacillus sp. LHD-117]|uniref:hypothetical protein n=1 Tax=Paenibacillus sp. LHD-117 TaxID=3071412 RepID=UPI0027DF4B63